VLLADLKVGRYIGAGKGWRRFGAWGKGKDATPKEK
jgi:hypothetical protein